MGAATRKLVRAEVDDTVGTRLSIVERLDARDGRVGGDAAAGAQQDQLRLRRQRATGIKTEDCACL